MDSFFKTKHETYFRDSLLVLLMVIAFGFGVLGKTGQVVPPPTTQDNIPLGCDDGAARQDYFVSEALVTLKGNSLLFVELRSGTGELSEKLVQERLFNINQYFRDRGSHLSAKKVLITVGPPVSRLGRIEYYLNGRLYQTLLYRKNGYICHSCCGPDKNYYPENYKDLQGFLRLMKADSTLGIFLVLTGFTSGECLARRH